LRRGPGLAFFEALAKDRPFVWAAYQAWKDSPTETERMSRAYDLMSSLEAVDPELARAWLDVLEELGWFRSASRSATLLAPPEDEREK